MDKQEYLETQRQIFFFANSVYNMPLKEFIELADKADAVGPILDPTLWRESHESLDIIRRLARGLKGFQDTAIKLSEESKHVTL